ncbi:MAG: hypothetical protein Q8K59_07350 [Nitrosomonas sp.]|nr:hypothetical protein [Nitrosomonas sp.]MDP1950893.1 hypothetical protein [Nitrosomonas sp.]
MRPNDLLLRCYANKDGDQWQIFCIDLCLAAQADTLSEARRKLHDMIREYIYDALVGEDVKFAGKLMRRKAPIKQVATYHYYSLMHKIGISKDGLHRLIRMPVPLIPADYVHE